MAEKLSEDLKIRIILDGTSNNGHNIPLSKFLSITDSCRLLLKQTAKSVLNGHECEILVSNLTHSSPACVEISLSSSVGDVGHRVISVLSEQAQKIRSGNTDSLEDEVLERWQKVTKYDKNEVSMFQMKSFGNLSDFSNDMIFEANVDFENALDGALNGVVCHTSIVGRVDTLNLHLEKGKLRVYSEVPQWKPVTVNFNDSFKERVLESIEKIVRIYGKAHYRPGRAMPRIMDMESIEILTKGGPRLADLKGIAPNITGGKSLQEYLDSLRREWD